MIPPPVPPDGMPPPIPGKSFMYSHVPPPLETSGPPPMIPPPVPPGGMPPPMSG